MLTLYPIDYKKFSAYALSLCQRPYSIWLDSSNIEHKHGHCSFVMTSPFENFNAHHDTQFIFNYLNNHALFSKNFQKKIKQTRHDFKNLPLFIGGFAGFFSYDYCVQQKFNLKNIPPKINMIPQFYGGLYDVVLYACHKTQQAGFVALNIHPFKKSDERIKEILGYAEKNLKTDNFQKIDIELPIISCDDYVKNVKKTIDYIKQGDIFQANIARSVTFTRPKNFNTLGFYKELRIINPSPFGCYIYDDDFQIMSASPERFLQINNNMITVEPIKGTIRSNVDPVIDKQQQEILVNCPKNRAENIMIVDLLRNDITPFAKTGTIKVEKLCELQTFKGLHHLVSNITAQLDDTASIFDVIKTALPGGSITGAPKKRVCEIIYELENAQRGAYCGSAGYIGFDGVCDLNILIRTVQSDKNSIIYHSGCGITAQSDPQSEWQETKTKAEKIIETLCS